jgi:hypothetical protein
MRHLKIKYVVDSQNMAQYPQCARHFLYVISFFPHNYPMNLLLYPTATEEIETQRVCVFAEL